MEEKIRAAIWTRLLRILEGSADLDPKSLRDCAAVLKETAAQPGAASDTEPTEYGVIILPPTLPDGASEAPAEEKEEKQA